MDTLESDSALKEFMRSQSRAFFYPNESIAKIEPFEGPDGVVYHVEKKQVVPTPQDGDSNFEIDESKTWDYVDENKNVFTLQDNDDETLTLVSCKNSSDELIVPDEIDNKPITAIAFFAFMKCEKLVSLVCPQKATKIHPNAFKKCSYLEKLVLPKSATRVQRAWFKALKQLHYLVLPDELPEISNKLFVSIALHYLYIGKNTKDIEAGAFNFCSITELEISSENLHLSTDGKSILKNDGSILLAYYGDDEYYALPEGCVEIQNNAFAYNKTLTCVRMPQSLVKIGTSAFANTEFTEFFAPDNLRFIQEKAFNFCPQLETVVLNAGLIEIGSDAFSRASIRTLCLPALLQNIGLHAFYDTPASLDKSLEEASAVKRPFGITIDPDNPYLFIDSCGGLYGRSAEGLIFLEMLSQTITTYEVQPHTIEIGERACINNSSLEHVILPDGLRKIGDSAFSNCKNLTEINIPESLVSIGREAFVKTSLRKIYLPKGLVSIGEMALRSSGKGSSHCSPGIEEVEIHPDNHVFFMHTGVLYQRFDEGIAALQYIGPHENVELVEGCTHIRTYAFAGQSHIRKLFIPASLKRIGYSGLMFEDAPEEIIIELKEPYQDHTCVTAYFSQDITSNQSIRKAFASAQINIADVFMYSDRAILHTLNLFTRAKLAIQRLIDPVYMSPAALTLFQQIFDKDLKAICWEFAHHDFLKGFDYLIKLGYLTKDNITPIIDKVSETNNVAVISYLLELKHRHFGSTLSLDLDL